MKFHEHFGSKIEHFSVFLSKSITIQRIQITELLLRFFSLNENTIGRMRFIFFTMPDFFFFLFLEESEFYNFQSCELSCPFYSSFPLFPLRIYTVASNILKSEKRDVNFRESCRKLMFALTSQIIIIDSGIKTEHEITLAISHVHLL